MHVIGGYESCHENEAREIGREKGCKTSKLILDLLKLSCRMLFHAV